jgi:hypothetical protein
LKRSPPDFVLNRVAFYIIFILTLLVFISVPNNGFSVSSAEIIAVTCPEKLNLGEKGEINYSIRNPGSEKIYILGSNITLDKPTKSNTSLTNFWPKTEIGYPFAINPYSTMNFGGVFRSDKLGYHYVHLSLSYSNEITKSSDVVPEENDLCTIVVSASESKDDPISGYVFQIALSIILFPVIAGLVEYFIKRSFVKRDFESEQRIQHSTWLLQHIHSVVTEYYLPLANYGALAKGNIEKASISKVSSDIQSAYYNTALYLGKIVEFERSIGGNFLFIEQRSENLAKTSSLEIESSLPFDRRDIDEIAKEVNKKKDKVLNEPRFRSIHFNSFSSWIKSENCENSRRQVEEKLEQFFKLLDTEGERALQPEYFMRYKQSESERKVLEIEKPLLTLNQISPKYAGRGDTVYIFGNGFRDTAYQFYIGNDVNMPLTHRVSNKNDYTELTIPMGIRVGTYDIFAVFKNKAGYDAQTIRIVIHIK